MIYLDYSATTPVNNEVIDTFVKTSTKYFSNPNSLHKLGIEANQIIEEANKKLASHFNTNKENIIYTSGSSESNNLALKGIALRYQKQGKHIITTNLEHSSVNAPISYLQKLGFDIDFVETTSDGLIDLEHLKSLIRNDTILISIASVNSEIGILQPINKIGKLIKDQSNAFFHCDMTQSLGKVFIETDNVDLISISAHKIYGLKGVGALIIKDNISLEPLIHGGKSTSIFRSGTPALPLIVSLVKAVRISLEKLDENYIKTKEINNYLIEKLNKLEYITINSNKYSIPHILNISLKDIKPLVIQNELSNHDIYISTQSACSGKSEMSLAVFNFTKDEKLAKTSIRISLSHLTSKEEIDIFVKVLDDSYKRLTYGNN